ncbi:MAG: Hsp20/alpha crystallin family protein [Xanthobacteraceae bacterium]
MAEPVKLPVKTERSPAPSTQLWRPFERLHREIDRLIEDFNGGFWRSPFYSPTFDLLPTSWAIAPAVDFTDTEKAYEVTAELPGIDEKNVEVKVANGVLTIKGDKNEEKEERKKGYYLRERNFGLFERSFQVPDGVDSDKIEASFKKGVLTVTLPKKPEAQKVAKRIDVKTA